MIEIKLLFQIRMSKTPAKVSEFLTSLASKLKPLWEKEKQKMLELKQLEVCILAPKISLKSLGTFSPKIPFIEWPFGE